MNAEQTEDTMKNHNAKIVAAAIRAEAAIIVADARLATSRRVYTGEGGEHTWAGNMPSFGGGSFRVEAGKISRIYGVPYDWALRVLCRRISAHFPRPPQTENGDWAWWWDGSWWSAPGYIGRAVAACVGER